MKHLLEKMLTECLTLAWQEWSPNNAGGASWLRSRTHTLLMYPCVFVIFFCVCVLGKTTVI